MWLKQFKIALIEHNSEKISKLLDEMPEFDSVAQMQEAQLLMAQAYEFIAVLKDETAQSIAKIQQNRDYLHVTKLSKTAKFDIHT